MHTFAKLLNIALLGLVLSILPTTLIAQPTTSDTVLAGINAYRASHNLPSQQLDPRISQLAKAHITDMAKHKIAFGHDGFSTRTHDLYSFFPHSQGMAENVAYADLDDSKAIVQSWINSSGHRRNILGHYNLTGIGVARDANGRVYVTQIFVSNNAKKSPQNNSFQQTFKHALSFNW
jgi:uncharacterized protein YkwD